MLYNLVIEYYNNIDKECIEKELIILKSISIIIHHEFISTPCIEINWSLIHKTNKIKRVTIIFIWIWKSSL